MCLPSDEMYIEYGPDLMNTKEKASKHDVQQLISKSDKSFRVPIKKVAEREIVWLVVYECITLCVLYQ